MIIRALKLIIATEEGNFGFSFSFSTGLTIIRGNNSSGKSTVFNSLLYALGMEEIIGGKGEKSLQYAVKEHFDYEGERLKVMASEVFIEIENKKGNIITIRRAIRDAIRDTKLLEIFPVAHLTLAEKLSNGNPTYIHDPGSAQKETGFHYFLEKFLNLNLPQVATTNGKETKLYIQTIFAALAIEQKRGWTDYIANIPFYGIRDARTCVIEFLLGLSVFEINAERNRLDRDSIQIDIDWRRIVEEFRHMAIDQGIIIEGLPNKPSLSFDSDLVRLQYPTAETHIDISHHLTQLREEFNLLSQKIKNSDNDSDTTMLEEIDEITSELQRLNVLRERASTLINMQKTSLQEYRELLKDAENDLDRNKTTIKLRKFGAQQDIEVALGLCPTCHQQIEDSLLNESIIGPQMDLESNISYLESQCRMLKQQIAGFQENIQTSEIKISLFSNEIRKKHDQLNSIRGVVSSGELKSKATIRKQVYIEMQIESLERLINTSIQLIEKLSSITNQYKNNQAARKLLPKNAYSYDDEKRISIFEKYFRANASSFDYQSAHIDEIRINNDTLIPCLEDIELKQIQKSKTDIKTDSSASDFVRLIWSYLIALHQTSSHPSCNGNHPNVLFFDEPGQHSMGVESQRALLLTLSGERNLQSIVAASFDESEKVFQDATSGVRHNLITWKGKLLKPLN